LTATGLGGRRNGRIVAPPGHVRQRHSSEDDGDSLSRKHTAEMLRKLRTLKHQVEMLKLRLDEEGATELRPRMLRPRRKQQSD